MSGAAGNRMLVEQALREPGSARKGRGRAVRSVTLNRTESPLGWLHARGHIDDRQLAAGERLRTDWERAQLAPSITMRWDAAGVGGAKGAREALTPRESQLAAKERFDAAVAAAGSGLSDILWRIVCAGEGMRDAEQALGWPARAGKIVLCLALDRVADFYRIR